ncbi:MAG: bifunctional 3-deoxy-7-phosphoheptulonate synthase/chorismate mutase [Lachnospiraceae bacterium]|nr:bifunctional 3-deoxy-7-phosphoheptulonate synthase/chorismate mutase [Lachnospiraceae bacterium]
MRPHLLVNEIDFPSLPKMFGHSSQIELIAGPCAVENISQMEEVAKELKNKNVRFMRGGAYKPRTSPYDFQGLGIEGLKMLKFVCEKYSLYSVSEVMSPEMMEAATKYVDIIQIGSRNMHNTVLLREAGKLDHPILLKRGMMSTLREFLLAAEYIVKEGNKKIVLCERGIKTLEDSTRNTLDISSIAIIKNETSLPVIVDISHSLGRKDIIHTVARALIALGIDGLMLEVHNNPAVALSDSQQQLSIEEFRLFITNLFEYNNKAITVREA